MKDTHLEYREFYVLGHDAEGKRKVLCSLVTDALGARSVQVLTGCLVIPSNTYVEDNKNV